jgi:hypothetical protein
MHVCACGLLQVRKERLGDRITALHQIVSPFGKVSKNIKKQKLHNMLGLVIYSHLGSVWKQLSFKKPIFKFYS